ncbi:hypothetical protein PMAYCL1PPCAC_29393, partial [Pristionchus mayeri]
SASLFIGFFLFSLSMRRFLLLLIGVHLLSLISSQGDAPYSHRRLFGIRRLRVLRPSPDYRSPLPLVEETRSLMEQNGVSQGAREGERENTRRSRSHRMYEETLTTSREMQEDRRRRMEARWRKLGVRFKTLPLPSPRIISSMEMGESSSIPPLPPPDSLLLPRAVAPPMHRRRPHISIRDPNTNLPHNFPPSFGISSSAHSVHEGISRSSPLPSRDSSRPRINGPILRNLEEESSPSTRPFSHQSIHSSREETDRAPVISSPIEDKQMEYKSAIRTHHSSPHTIVEGGRRGIRMPHQTEVEPAIHTVQDRVEEASFPSGESNPPNHFTPISGMNGGEGGGGGGYRPWEHTHSPRRESEREEVSSPSWDQNQGRGSTYHLEESGVESSRGGGGEGSPWEESIPSSWGEENKVEEELRRPSNGYRQRTTPQTRNYKLSRKLNNRPKLRIRRPGEETVEKKSPIPPQYSHLTPFQNAARERFGYGDSSFSFPKRFAAGSETHKAYGPTNVETENGDSASGFGTSGSAPSRPPWEDNSVVETSPPPPPPSPSPRPRPRPTPPPAPTPEETESLVIPNNSGLRPVAPPKEFEGGFGSAGGGGFGGGSGGFGGGFGGG